MDKTELGLTKKYRAVGRSENPGVPVVIRWAYSVPLIEIGLTDLPKSGCAMAHPGTTGLKCQKMEFQSEFSMSKNHPNLSKKKLMKVGI